MPKLPPKTVAWLCTGLLAISSSVQAQSLLNVKIGSTTQDASADGAYQESAAAVLGTANSYWNEYAYVSSTPSGVSVVDSTGAGLSGVTLTVQNSQGVGHLTTSGNPSFLMNDMPYMNAGGVFTISIAGLLANAQYEFVGYAAYPGLTLGASWAVTTGTLDSGTSSNDGTSADITTGVGKAYSAFMATTDGSGNLVITDSSLTSAQPVLSGFQLQAAPVPEPGTWTLLAGGFGVLLVFRRSQRVKAS